MKKSKAITLLTIISVFLATLILFTFLRFTAGLNDYRSILGAVRLDYDIAGGYTYELTLADDNPTDIDDEKVLSELSDRLDFLGYKGYTIKANRSTKSNASASELRPTYVINLPCDIDNYGMDNVAVLTGDVSAVARSGEIKVYGGAEENPTTEIEIDGKIVNKAYIAGTSVDQNKNEIGNVAIQFTDEAFKAITDAEAAVGEESLFYLRITVGDYDVISSYFASKDQNGVEIEDNTIYYGRDLASAKQIALLMDMGGMEYKFNEVNDDSYAKTTPLLGENSATLIAVSVGAIALIAVAVMIILLRGYGVVSAISLVAFLFSLVGLLVAVPGIVLSIPGVVGILVAFLFTVVGLFITGKRFSEEFAKGKTVKSAAKTAYNGTFRGMLNALVVMVVFALAIFIFTTGTVQCFGITLGIGAALSFASTVLLSRLLTSCLIPICKNPESFFNLKREDA